uniref:Phenylalanine N-monooxygenase-like n=1 Tax=Nicotiana tabacum TaxID=4097 RepID=A0A1S4BE23_TOBAC|nr:PREDICTED: uncharacterized protein LOC107807333 [Nicotiana tabacum]
MAIEEIDLVIGSSRLVQKYDLPQLNYVKACIKEAFRLHPISSFNVPYVSVFDTIVGEYFIPKGNVVQLSRIGLGRNPRVWEDTMKFKPERHVNEESREVVLTDSELRLLSFSIGRRGCPGMQLGSTITIMLIARLLQGFTWSLLPNSPGNDLVQNLKCDLSSPMPLFAQLLQLLSPTSGELAGKCTAKTRHHPSCFIAFNYFTLSHSIYHRRLVLVQNYRVSAKNGQTGEVWRETWRVSRSGRNSVEVSGEALILRFEDITWSAASIGQFGLREKVEVVGCGKLETQDPRKMITDVEAVTSAQEIQGQRVQQGSTVVEENRTLKQQMTQIRQAWANGQGQPCHESRFATQQEQYHSPEYHSYSFELPVNIEKPARKRVQEEITQRVKRLEQRLKNTQAMA